MLDGPGTDSQEGIGRASSCTQRTMRARLSLPAQGKQVKQVSGKRVAMRSLAILERLSALSYAADLAEKLVDALLAMLTQKAGKRRARIPNTIMGRTGSSCASNHG